MAITSTTIREGVYKELADIIDINKTGSLGYTVSDSWPDKVSELPIVAIGEPILPRKRQAFGTSSVAYNRDGTINVWIFAENTQAVVQIIDDVENAVFDNLSSLDFDSINLEDPDTDYLEMEGRTIKIGILPFSIKVRR